MRHLIKGLVAAVAVVTVSAAPALACGGGPFSSCAPPVYVAPAPTCGCGAAYERLPDPVREYDTAPVVHQYYYADQGPDYSGPGDFAPRRVYREGGWGYRHHMHHYGYGPHPHWHHAYAPHHYGYHEHILRRYY